MLNLVNVLAAGSCTCSSFTVPAGIVGLIHAIIIIIQVAVPIMLIIWGMIDFAKSTIGGDEDKIKQGQKIFTRRLIAGILVFLVVTIVQLVISAVGNSVDDQANSAWSCAQCIIGNGGK